MNIDSIDILLASHNGAATLEKVFDAWRRLEDPGVGWRAVVVDNGSDDNTRQIIEEYSKVLPIEYVFEGSRGKNRALNAGLPHVRGDLIVFTDDDAVPEPGWLKEFRLCALRHPEFSLFGGTVIPGWPQEPQEWILHNVPLNVTFAFDTFVRTEGPAMPSQMIGPNLAIRRTVFDNGNHFDESIGPTRGQYAMGSETEFCYRVARLGHKCGHAPNAVVRHIIRPYQLAPKWILARAFRYGRRMVRLGYSDQGHPQGTGVRKLFGAPRWLIRHLGEAWLRLIWRKVLFDRGGAFRAEWEINCIRGQIFESRLQLKVPLEARVGE